jgi:hypothetical protein
MRGVLNFGPTGTVIRRKEFEALGRFSGTRYIGDTEMWYKIALKYPIVKMVPGLIFWRRHDDQEITKGMESQFYLENSYKHTMQTLHDPQFPLSITEVAEVKKRVDKRFGRDLLRLMLIKRQFKKGQSIMESCDYSWKQLFKSV